MASLNRIQTDIETLRDISAPCEEGTTRLSYTPAYRKAADYVMRRMEEAGLEVRQDGIGTIYGRLPGTVSSLPPIMSGSHLDTVLCSGAFDGQAGIVCALEAARMLKENKIALKHPFEVVATVMEDGARFPGVAGSRFMAGIYGEAELDSFQDYDGVSLRTAIKEYGLSGDISDVSLKENPPEAFVELHLEQGSILEDNHIQIGIVERIFGGERINITIHGSAAHPSTPMDIRHDSALASFYLITEIAGYVKEKYRGRATITVGRMFLHPNSVNAIPSRTSFVFDIRSGYKEYIEEIRNLIQNMLPGIEEAYKVSCEMSCALHKDPMPTTPLIQEQIERAAQKLKITSKRMVSGAAHDALVMGNICDIGMIFVPSHLGLTHCPQEWTDYENLVSGTDVLYETIIQLDNRKSDSN